MKKYFLVIIPLTLAFFAACASASTFTLHDPEEQLERDRLREVITKVNDEQETNKKSIYNAKNTISFLLDRGLLRHYAGDYAASNKDLQKAERLIEEAFTKDVSDNFSAFMTDDPYKKEYSGEAFENIYVNIFCALNYYRLGDLENALVEVRRLNEKLVYIRDSYEAFYARRSSPSESSRFSERIYYTHSALARFLSMLFWRGQGKPDDARIDSEEVTAAFKASPSIYYFSMPDISKELSIPKGTARINLLSFTGLSPVKTPLSANLGYFRFYWGRSSTNDEIPFETERPFAGFVFRRSPINRIEAVFNDGKKVELSLLEDMGGVIQQISITQAVNIEVMRKIIRGATYGVGGIFDAVKYAAKGSANVFSGKEDKAMADVDDEKNMVDVRMSKYLPERAYVGGINLPPGTYSFTINYYSGNTLVDSRRFQEVKAEEGKLNLITDYSWQFVTSLPGMELSANLPDFPGRLSAPVVKAEKNVSDSGKYVRYNLNWELVPGALAYYVYKKNPLDGKFYLIGQHNKPASFFTRIGGTFIVVAIGRNGFGVPSRQVSM